MNLARIKIDTLGAGERIKGGLSNDNEIRYYTWLNLAKEKGYLVESEEGITGEKSSVNEEFQSFILGIFRISGVRRLWLYPNAVHVQKIVAADWHTDKCDGVHDQVCAAFKEELRIRYPKNHFEVVTTENTPKLS